MVRMNRDKETGVSHSKKGSQIVDIPNKIKKFPINKLLRGFLKFVQLTT